MNVVVRCLVYGRFFKNIWWMGVCINESLRNFRGKSINISRRYNSILDKMKWEKLFGRIILLKI